MQHDFTTPQDPAPCTCTNEVCTFMRVMARHIPELPQDLEEMTGALTIMHLIPEAREALQAVIHQFDGMSEHVRRLTVLLLDDMDPPDRALATLMLHDGIRGTFKSMARKAELGRF